MSKGFANFNGLLIHKFHGHRNDAGRNNRGYTGPCFFAGIEPK